MEVWLLVNRHRGSPNLSLCAEGLQFQRKLSCFAEPQDLRTWCCMGGRVRERDVWSLTGRSRLSCLTEWQALGYLLQAWGLGQGPVPSPEVEGRAWRSAGQPDGIAVPLTRGCECHSQLLKHTSSQEAGPSPSPSHTHQPFLGFYS